MSRFVLLVTLALTCTQALADHSAQVKRLVEPLVESGTIVGCVVGITDNGKQETYGFGEIHRGQADKPNGDTIYEIGSITKAFTGTLLGDLVVRGLIDLDAPLQDFLPTDVKLQPFQGHTIKLVDVASQSSGLPRLPTNIKPKDPKNPYVDYPRERMFEFLKDYQVTRAPGEYEYSNLGMGLLGCILTEKSGKKSYEELVVERVCDPLRMFDTRITLSDDQRKRFAPPYSAELKEEHTWEFDAFAGAGALRSTTNDMLKFAEAALSGDDRPVAKAIHEAWKPHFGKPGDIRVGLGWHLARDGETWLHSGQTAGYSSALYVYPPKKMAVVVLCNTATENATILTEKLLLAALGAKPDPIELRKTVDVAPAALKSYEGTYVLSLFFAITITVENGKLMAQATNQEKAQIFPESDTNFFYKVVNAQITFEKDKDGKVAKLVLHQNGRDMPGIKVPESGSGEAKEASTK
jgi:CubicO group peptidase (beta-lactamase class C family)